jgi:putative hemolysin
VAVTDEAIEKVTMAGFLASAAAALVPSRLGHIPTAPGDSVQVDGHTAEVTQVTGRAVTQLRLRPAGTPAARVTTTWRPRGQRRR